MLEILRIKSLIIKSYRRRALPVKQINSYFFFINFVSLPIAGNLAIKSLIIKSYRRRALPENKIIINFSSPPIARNLTYQIVDYQKLSPPGFAIKPNYYSIFHRRRASPVKQINSYFFFINFASPPLAGNLVIKLLIIKLSSPPGFANKTNKFQFFIYQFCIVADYGNSVVKSLIINYRRRADFVILSGFSKNYFFCISSTCRSPYRVA